MTAAIDFGPCDDSVISGLINQELDSFVEHIYAHPAPQLQYLRSGLIAWISVFYPEAITKEQKKKIVNTVRNLQSQHTYDQSLWYRLPFLEISAYVQTQDIGFLKTIISNIDHYSSQLRLILHTPLALVAPSLNFNMPGLHQGIVSNFSRAHFYNDNLLCILCALSNDAVSKLAAVERLLDRHDLSPQDKSSLQKLMKEKSIENSIIFDDLSEISRYTLCRILSFKVSVDTKPDQTDLFSMSPIIAPVSIFWERMQQHPLLNSLVHIKN